LILLLCFVLSLIALASFILVKKMTPDRQSLKISPKNVVRGLKGEELKASVELSSHDEKWCSVEISEVIAPPGVEVKQSRTSKHTLELSLIPRFAGTFRGLLIRTEVRDQVGLFARSLSVEVADFEIESLPLSLLASVQKAMPFLLALGERTAGTRGSGQEFYSIDDYKPFGETKDILWKRVARMPDEKLVVKLRESNLPKVVKIGLVEFAERSREERLRWMDLCSEGVALLSKSLLGARCRVSLIHRSVTGAVGENTAENESELVDALSIMGSAAPATSKMMIDSYSTDILNRSDIIVTGLKEMQESNFAGAVSRKPSLIIKEEASPTIVSEHSVIFTGEEDVRRLIARAVQR
jgi:uncharacterized protein (DUF58 family)